LDRSTQADTLPTLSGVEKRRYVFGMFTALAPDYDRWNGILSMGLDQMWRRRAIRPLVNCRLVCDLGTGTGDMVRALFSNASFKGSVLAVDPTRALWDRPSQADLHGDPRCRFALAEGEHLPFEDDSCDGIMSGFVMRNFFDLDMALRESSRIVAPGGTAIFLEMGHPRSAIWRFLFNLYFQRLAPAVAGWFSNQRAAYRYLPESLARFPAQSEVRSRFLANGWQHAEYKEYLGGAIIVYRATK
jgi:demethylmenaquinone methyltransferase/2-methoxy-6-polyprenyl-1,4-benzoquinol methylase